MPLLWFVLGGAALIMVQRFWRRLVWGLLARGDSLMATVTDTPIYDNLKRNGTATLRPGLVVGDEELTEPVSRAVADALSMLEETHYHEAVAVLAPFGLHPYDIARPEYRRVVYRDEA